jgi:ketosteroid isomerase-like protein
MALLSSFAAIAASANGAPGPNFRELYDRYEEAVRRMDSRAYMAMFTDNFAMISPDGKTHDRAEMAKFQTINTQTTRKVNSYSVTIESVTPVENGDFAVIVLQEYDRDQAPLDRRDELHNIRTKVVQLETWHSEGGAWKIRRIEEILSGPTYFDNKVMA